MIAIAACYLLIASQISVCLLLQLLDCRHSQRGLSCERDGDWMIFQVRDAAKSEVKWNGAGVSGGAHKG